EDRAGDTFVEQTYESRRDEVSPADAPAYLRALEEAGKGLWFSAMRTSLPERAKEKLLPVLGLLAALIAVPIVAGSLLRGLRRRRFVEKTRLAPGEAPATAYRVSDEAEMKGRLLALRCSCGARAGDRNTERQTLVFNDRPMTAVTRKCAWCGAEQT